MEKIGLTINEVVSLVSLKIISQLKGKKINSDQVLVDRVHEEDDGYKTYYSNMVYNRLVKIIVGEKIFWFGLGTRTGIESPETFGLILIDVNKWPYCLEKAKGDKKLFQVIVNKYNYLKESRVLFVYKDGSFWLNKNIKMLPSAELMNKFVIQKPEFNPEYIYGRGEKYVERDILYNQDFVDYLVDVLIGYIQNC